MPYDDNQRLKGLILNANDIPPEMLEEDANTKYNKLLGQYEDMYKTYSNIPEKSQQDLAAAKAERDRADNIARYADFGQELASAFNIAHGGQGFQATAGDKLRKRGQLTLEEAKQANKDLIAANLQKMKGAESLLGMYQKDISDKDKRASEKEQREINKGYLDVQQAQERRASVKDIRDAEKDQEALKNIKDDHDPMSAKSKLLQEYIAQRFPEYGEMVKDKAYAELDALSKQMMNKSQLSEYQQLQFAMKKDDRIDTQVEKLTKRLADPQDDIVGQTLMLENLSNTMNKLGVSFDSLKGKDLPGYGATGFIPNIMASKEGVNLRQDVSGLANALLKSRSGAAVTNQEEKRFLEEMGTGKTTMSDENVRRGLKKIKDIMERRTKMIEAYPDEVKVTLKERTGMKLPSEILEGLNKKKDTSSQDQQALEWAKSNPNDPRSKMILQKLGIQ